ncbi:MAG: type I restriction endonuclease subunit S, partial [Gammaproteobacteria bacterium]|nr:type I restriction endonuclease subunit S [Gammaproteobacteria bacterium]
GVYHNLPVIIFDDFTTDFKYVDFPFKVKLSAIKILKTCNAEVDLKFIFERMRLIKFPLGEHKRYYISEYQIIQLPTPKLYEQTAIATVLSDMDSEIAALEQRRNKTQAIKQAMMQELLTGKTRLV